jgi:hypothetical protein
MSEHHSRSLVKRTIHVAYRHPSLSQNEGIALELPDVSFRGQNLESGDAIDG